MFTWNKPEPEGCELRAEEQARIRVQMSAAHQREQLERASAAFARVGRELGVIR